MRVQASFLENAVNGLSKYVTNSPLNEGKKALAVKQAGDYDPAATRAEIQQYLDDNGVVVFSWTRCPFCVKAKGLLDDIGAKYKAVELDTMGQQGAAIRAELGQMTGRTSMPNVFISKHSYGGCNDGPGVMTLQKEGKLVPLLKGAGAL